MLLLILAIAGAGIFGVTALWLASLFSVTTQSHDHQVVKALERKGDVVVVAASVVGMDDDKNTLNFYGLKIPGSEKALFLRYEFDAKLGFDGLDVKIEPTGDDSFLVTIPKFTFIGYDNWNSEIAAQENGILSLFTPSIDDREMADKFLNEERKQEYVSTNTQLLEEHAQDFYKTVVGAIDPEITLEFAFTK